MTATYMITYDDGVRKASEEFKAPERLAQPGDVYQVVSSFYTLGRVSYEPGDRLVVLERTNFAPHHRKSSLGNLLVKGKFSTSVWACLEMSIVNGWLKLVTEPGV